MPSRRNNAEWKSPMLRVWRYGIRNRQLKFACLAGDGLVRTMMFHVKHTSSMSTSPAPLLVQAAQRVIPGSGSAPSRIGPFPPGSHSDCI